MRRICEKNKNSRLFQVFSSIVRGSETYFYSLKSRRGTTVRVKAKLTLVGDGSQAFSLDLSGKAGTCCEGETYMPLSAESTLQTSFRVTTDESFLMFFNFSAVDNALHYQSTSERLNFDPEPVGDENTIIVPGNSGSRWIDTGIEVRRADRVTLSATGTVDVGGSRGTPEALVTTRFARV